MRVASTEGAGPLLGLHVIDFSRTAPGPYCGMLLADMGADVIRVDRAPLEDADEHPFGDVLGRGKQSISLNLKHPKAVEAALRLIEWADVLIEGFRPGVMERLGLGPAVALARNPRLIYARVTGWGQTGPLKDRAGHDINYIAVSGALGLIGRLGERPVAPLNMIGDFAGGGLWAAAGILAALFERERSGLGQEVDAAMVDGSANLNVWLADAIQDGRWGERGTNLLDSGAHFYDVYECADGGYYSVGAIEPQFYAELVGALGLDLASLPPQMDAPSWPKMKTLFTDIFRTKTRDEWTDIFGDHDACAQPVLEPSEVAQHRLNMSRNTYVLDTRGVPQPGPGPRLSRTPSQIRHPAPRAGEHTIAVLTGVGFSDDEISTLLTDNAAAAFESKP